MIQLHDKRFRPYISQAELKDINRLLGRQITQDFAGEQPVFVVVLNGAFMFAADLVRAVNLPVEMVFIRTKSYIGTTSSGKVQMQLTEELKNLQGRSVVLIEDIVDTGNTAVKLLEMMQQYRPKTLKFACLLFKPDALQHDITIDYIGKTIPDKFVVGYGLDYDELGRNLADIYQLI
ncbi:MAG: hypoxanthine phosphoribosyltransferase [Chitinophagales bacterium]